MHDIITQLHEYGLIDPSVLDGLPHLLGQLSDGDKWAIEEELTFITEEFESGWVSIDEAISEVVAIFAEANIDLV